MEGQVFVPYTGIGGYNMNTGIMPMSLTGSTDPDVMEDEFPASINVRWIYPGGIIGIKDPGGEGSWGYAVAKKAVHAVPNTDTDIKNWLTNNLTFTPEITPQHGSLIGGYYTVKEVDDEIPDVALDINRLLQAYVSRLFFDTGSEFDLFKQYYITCYEGKK